MIKLAFGDVDLCQICATNLDRTMRNNAIQLQQIDANEGANRDCVGALLVLKRRVAECEERRFERNGGTADETQAA
jgi:hypothetical protein